MKSFEDLGIEKTNLIYLAGPYSHNDLAIQRARALTHMVTAGQLLAAGWLIYSPIAHCHPLFELQNEIPQFELKGDAQFWGRYNEKMLLACDQLVVLMLDGWAESKGVTAEITIAAEIGIPTMFIVPDYICTL